jgi:restriction system protein
MPVMNLKMNQNSIFAILLRSPWWMSGLLAAGLFFLGRMIFPTDFQIYAIFLALPFIVIASITLWKALRAPSEAGVAAKLDALRALQWQEFCASVEEAFTRDGYSVKRLSRPGADLQITKAGRVAVVGCKRWKVARAGVEPLRELDAAREAQEAHEAIFLAAGEVTATARAFAAEKKIRLIEHAELVRLLPRPAGGTAARA